MEIDTCKWQHINAWRDVDENIFYDYKWQLRNSLTNINTLEKIIPHLTGSKLIKDLLEGQKQAPMNIRVTPYILALINWEKPYVDPLRKQFLPLASEMLPDHPYTTNDPLAEESHIVADALVHRYPDKVLFLPTTACPVYCAFCTRSRLVGGTTDTKVKEMYGAHPKRWQDAFNYIRKHPAVEDVVISGGDSFMIPSKYISEIGMTLLDMPNIRRIRFATKGLATLPMKILTDALWVEAIEKTVNYGRAMGKQVSIHTHFNHPQEITHISVKAMERLFSLGVTVRNQSVLLNGINNNVHIMGELIKKLSYINIQPYYVYLHDMIPSCEHFRTSLSEAIELEKQLRGMTAGFNTPTIVCDLPGGGGKRPVVSYETYDKKLGTSSWHSPNISKDRIYYYYDPIHTLSSYAEEQWRLTKKIASMI